MTTKEALGRAKAWAEHYKDTWDERGDDGLCVWDENDEKALATIKAALGDYEKAIAVSGYRGAVVVYEKLPDGQSGNKLAEGPIVLTDHPQAEPSKCDKCPFGSMLKEYEEDDKAGATVGETAVEASLRDVILQELPSPGLSDEDERALGEFIEWPVFEHRFNHCGAMNSTQLSERDWYLKLKNRAAVATSRLSGGKK